MTIPPVVPAADRVMSTETSLVPPPPPHRPAAPLVEALLPDGSRVFCRRLAEALSVYDQVQGYFKHGIRIEAGATVFDVGANIGLFTLLAHRLCRGEVHALAFEPIPTTFDVLAANLRRSGSSTLKAFNCGVGRESGTLQFSYYPNFSVLSTAYGSDMEELREDLKQSFLRNLATAPAPLNRLRLLPPFLRRRVLDWKMAQSFIAEEVRCPIRTVSEVIREEGVDCIDLLKIDAEKSELDVLLGIDERDWTKIRQTVLEVHDLDGRLQIIRDLLEKHGLSQITIEQDANLKGSRIFTLFAQR
jgi:FkbM family methyltransferase